MNPVLDETLLSEGPLKVHVWLDGAGQLGRITLPAHPPDQADPAHYLRLLKHLARFPLAHPVCSPFTQRVLNRISKIPFGETLSYAELASDIGHPKACRAAGSACGRNRLLLRIPCHRVTAKTWEGGYAAGPEWKRFLIRMESQSLRPA